MAAPANNQQRSFLASLLMGGGGRRNDPYANQAAGPFASSPRIYGGSSPAASAPAAARPKVAAAKAGAAKAGGGGGDGGGGGSGSKGATTKSKARPQGGGQYDLPAAKNATSPSSLLQSPEMNATSPSSLMQNPGTPYNQVMPNAESFNGVYPPRADVPTSAPANQPPIPGLQPTSYPGAIPATGNTIPSPQAISRPFSPTPPTGALNMYPQPHGGSMGAPMTGIPSPVPAPPTAAMNMYPQPHGGSMGAPMSPIPSPMNFALHPAATGNTMPSPQALSRPFAPTPPTGARNMYPQPRGGSMGAPMSQIPSPQPTQFSLLDPSTWYR